MATIKSWVMWGILVGTACSVATAAERRTRQQDLIGAWRLVRIEVTGPLGSSADPFYGTGSEGVMIYDRAGWFSVQIMGSNRPDLDVPMHRPDADEHQRAERAAALDSYYAYYGTWTFDPSTSTVTHHAKGALYPAERDATYPQHVEVQGATMTFSRTQEINGQRSTQRKIWQRAPTT